MSSLESKRALFVQPFSLGANGGGSRIFSSMIKGQPFAKLSLNCNPRPGPPLNWIEERHIPVRPWLGRIDHTRFTRIGEVLEVVLAPNFDHKMARAMDEWQPDTVHIIPHGPRDFYVAWRLARERNKRVVMSVHDDLTYTLPASLFREKALRMLAKVWPDVDHVYAISQEMGEEYCQRFGRRPFEIITDGVETIAARPLPAQPGRLNVYFMGLFHYNYRYNLGTLTQALARIKNQQPALDVNLTMRCGFMEKGIDAAFPAKVLTFADQATVVREMAEADLLYMPLPIGPQYEAFTRFSLSTKMVSYLGSGVPILLHAPRNSAAAQLLLRHNAAVVCDSQDPADMVKALQNFSNPAVRQEIVENALRLARTTFPMEDLRQKFARGLFL